MFCFFQRPLIRALTSLAHSRQWSFLLQAQMHRQSNLTYFYTDEGGSPRPTLLHFCWILQSRTSTQRLPLLPTLLFSPVHFLGSLLPAHRNDSRNTSPTLTSLLGPNPLSYFLWPFLRAYQTFLLHSASYAPNCPASSPAGTALPLPALAVLVDTSCFLKALFSETPALLLMGTRIPGSFPSYPLLHNSSEEQPWSCHSSAPTGNADHGTHALTGSVMTVPQIKCILELDKTRM